MMFARIVGTGSCLPGNPVSNSDLAARGIETSDEWIVTRTGIRTRHLAEPGVTSSELGLIAAQRALEMAGLQAGDIDLIIVATSTPDFIFPSTACLIQGKLGNKGAAAFDVQAVCSGFIYALTVADADLHEIVFEIEIAVAKQRLIFCLFFQQIKPVPDGIKSVGVALADEFRQKMAFEIADATTRFILAVWLAITDFLPAFNLA